MNKKIIHLDMDCFFAAVEMRDNPSLQTIPIAIGGAAERRGVISTCNYLAREYGVRSAMASSRALALCPSLTLIKGDMAKYKRESAAILAILRRYTDKIEPLSLDEAYLDVSDLTAFKGSATLIAQDIRRSIFNELGLTASAGIAPVKFIAKIASDLNKPNGMYVVPPRDVDDFVQRLPLEKIPGVGKVTLAKLQQLQLFCGKDVQQFSQSLLLQHFGKFGQVLWQRCHGIDLREVEVNRARKSIGVEHTLAQDIVTKEQCLALVAQLSQELLRRLSAISPALCIARQGVKIKFADFQQTTVEQKQATFDPTLFIHLLDKALLRQHGRSIRLIGLSVSLQKNDASTFPTQLALNLSY